MDSGDILRALKEFSALQSSLLGQRVRPHHRRCKRKASSSQHHCKSSIPRPAIHYTPLREMSIEQALAVRSSLPAFTATNNGLPAQFTPDEVHFVIDTGASITITNDKTDFLSDIHPIQPTRLKGIASGLSVKGIGDAEYTFMTDDGSYTTVLLERVLYVPDCTVRILCPRHLAECTGIRTDGFNSIRDVGILTCNNNKITVPYHTGTGLPIITTATGIEHYHKFCAAMSASLSTTITQNLPLIAPVGVKQNLTPHQRLKLLIHERCNHKNMKAINHWIRSGLLPVDANVASAPDPICVACQYGKAHKKVPYLRYCSYYIKPRPSRGRCKR